MVASIGCSLFLVGLLSRKPLSQMHRSTFLPLQPAATLIFSVDWGLTIGTIQATLGRGFRASGSAKAAVLSVLDCSECLQIGFGGQQILTSLQSRSNGNASPPGGCNYRVTEC